MSGLTAWFEDADDWCGYSPLRPVREGMQPECWEADPLEVTVTKLIQYSRSDRTRPEYGADIVAARRSMPAAPSEPPAIVQMANSRPEANMEWIALAQRIRRRPWEWCFDE